MQFYLRTQYSKFTDHETRDRFRLPIAGTIVPTNATTGLVHQGHGHALRPSSRRERQHQDRVGRRQVQCRRPAS
jgi:hypothetical protein